MNRFPPIPQWFRDAVDMLPEPSPAASAAPPGDEVVDGALAQPVWDDGPERSLRHTLDLKGNTCIVVSDHTRSSGLPLVLPALLHRLTGWGVNPQRISLLVASGIHRAPTPAELRALLGGPAFEALSPRTACHHAEADSELVHVGAGPGGHPVRINRRVLETDNLILTGSALYHYHAGYGGGRKSLVPGLADRATIAMTHSRAIDPVRNDLDPRVQPGRLTGNPVAEAMMDCARHIEPAFILNTVMTPHGIIASAHAGSMRAAHAAACADVDRWCGFKCEAAADIVLASAGGARNWIQSHKALYNASRAVSESGCIVLLAACPEGLGNARFRHWLEMRSIPAMVASLRRTPEVNGQTALSTRLRGRHTILVTDLPPAERHILGIQTAPTPAEALRLALERTRDRGHARPTCLPFPGARYLTPFTQAQSTPHRRPGP